MIFDFLWKLAASALYGAIRSVVWLFTNRRCAKCKHLVWNARWNVKFCELHGKEYNCCQNRPWRPYFSLNNEKPKRKFFDIL